LNICKTTEVSAVEIGLDLSNATTWRLARDKSGGRNSDIVATLNSVKLFSSGQWPGGWEVEESFIYHAYAAGDLSRSLI
jgi:hypothetical protein